MSNENQLYLLADHIKLSLLERKRARSLNLPSDSQDGHISRSLDQFKDGLEGLEKEKKRYQDAGDDENALALADAVVTLTKQLDELTAQFHGFSSVSSSSTLVRPNDPTLSADFAHATSIPASSTAAQASKGTAASKSVRFSSHVDSASPSPPPIHTPATTVDGDTNVTNTASSSHGVNPLFASRYRDNPSLAANDETEGYRDHIDANELSNQQIHAYHDRILRDQDEQLDALGASIARQRELGLRMGDELDEQVAMLEEQENLVDRHQTRVDRARRQVGRIANAAGESRQMVIIAVLIVILVFLIIVLK